jgi:gamma-glutamyl-gamma-aminobutyrate hydrolase PuuD
VIAIGITQRSLSPTEFGERRDALDIRWPRFLAACDVVGVPLPNDPALAVRNASALTIGGILLTGGDDLGEVGGQSPLRDETERLLLEWALAREMPVMGVCRGMQLIMLAFGSRLERVDHHVAVRHDIMGEICRSVNSYHRWGATSVARPLVAAAKSGKVVEAIRHAEAPVLGVMWHPEREFPVDEADRQMLRDFLQLP